jgi:nucleotide-binding universal stress UspA family protein
MLNYANILVPVDFEKGSDSAIEQAAEHSQASGSNLFVAHVLEGAEQAEAATRADCIARAEKQLDELLDSLEIGYCEKIVSCGETVPTLLKIVQEQNIDLTVMGTRLREEPSRLVKSITVAVVAETDCDVLVLHK